MAKTKLTVLLILFVSSFLQAQVNRYMVFFENKSGTPFTLSNPSEYLGAKAIERRLIQNISIDSMDLPTSPNYVKGITDLGITVLHKSKWMNGVLVECTSADLSAIEALEFVKSVEFVAPGGVPSSGGRIQSKKFEATETTSAPTDIQLAMLGLDEMQLDGFRGEGITIAVFDGGFLGANSAPSFQDIFNEGRFNDVSYDFVSNTSDVFVNHSHGTNVWSIIAGYEDGAFIGGAFKANFQLYRTEDVATEYRIEEYNWLFAGERADSAGVDIINTSLGYNTFDDSQMDYGKNDMDGKTTVISRSAKLAIAKGIFLVASAGNSGNDPSWQIITAPADGDDVLAVGNINNKEELSVSSSIGPSADGRIKPDVVALGTGVSIVRADGTIGSGNGTSFSSPLTTGLVAGLLQKYPTLTNKSLLNAIRSSSSRSYSPDNSFGYGIPHYRAVSNYLDQQSQQNVIDIYPNPTAATITIRPRNPVESKDIIFKLINANGKAIDEHAVTFTWLDNAYQADLSPIAEGLYFLRVWAGTHFYTYKLMKR